MLPRHDGIGEQHAVTQDEQNGRKREAHEAIYRRLRQKYEAQSGHCKGDGKRDVILPRERNLKALHLGGRLSKLAAFRILALGSGLLGCLDWNGCLPDLKSPNQNVNLPIICLVVKRLDVKSLPGRTF